MPSKAVVKNDGDKVQHSINFVGGLMGFCWMQGMFWTEWEL